MAKFESDGKYPKRIGDQLLYELHGVGTMRTISGFTSEGVKKLPKYILCRQNNSEFGRLSSTNKHLRVALAASLSKKNNLAITNTLNQKMRALLPFDTVS